MKQKKEETEKNFLGNNDVKSKADYNTFIKCFLKS